MKREWPWYPVARGALFASLVGGWTAGQSGCDATIYQSGDPGDHAVDAGLTAPDARAVGADAAVIRPDAALTLPDAGQSPDARSGAAYDCDSPATILCDSFEDGLAANGWRTGQRFGGTARIDQTRALTGNSALHVHLTTEAGTAGELILDSSSPNSMMPMAARELYGRVFMTASPDHPDRHAYLIRFRGDNYEQSIDSGRGRIRIAHCDYTDARGDAACTRTQGVRPDPQEWACIEWHFNPARRAFDLWLDGELIGSQGGDQDPPVLFAPAWGSIRVGRSNLQESGLDVTGFDIWYDDLVMSGERIGCDR